MDKYDAYVITTALAVLSGVVRSAFLTRFALFYGIYAVCTLVCLLFLWKTRTAREVPVKYDCAIAGSYFYVLSMGMLELLLWDEGASITKLANSLLYTILPSLVVFYTLDRVISRVGAFSYDDASQNVFPRPRVLSTTN